MNHTQSTSVTSSFSSFARRSAVAMGHPLVFGLAIATILVWALTGPLFEFSDSWQLVMNTFTSIVTFLMVFVIQNSQNRDSVAIQVKLNELIRAVEGAKNRLIDIEEDTQADLEEVKRGYKSLAKEARDQDRELPD